MERQDNVSLHPYDTQVHTHCPYFTREQDTTVLPKFTPRTRVVETHPLFNSIACVSTTTHFLSLTFMLIICFVDTSLL